MLLIQMFGYKNLVKYGLVSPFGGSAAFEMAAASVGVKTYVADANGLFVNMLNQAINSPERLRAHCLDEYYDNFMCLGKGCEDHIYEACRRHWHAMYDYFKKSGNDPESHMGMDMSETELAAMYFFYHFGAYGNMTQKKGFGCRSTNMSQKLDRMQELAQLTDYDFKYVHMDYKEAMFGKSEMARRIADGAYMYIDPPYVSKHVFYGSPLGPEHGSTFGEEDHERLADYLNNERTERWILSYNYCDRVRELYNDRRMFNIKGHRYALKAAMNFKKAAHLSRDIKAKEVMIFSDDIVNSIGIRPIEKLSTEIAS